LYFSSHSRTAKNDEQRNQIKERSQQHGKLLHKGENTSVDRPTVGKRAVETVTINARQSYVYKCGKLDKKCAPDDPTEPFSRALGDNFHFGGAHPMVFGAFGECNKKVKWLVTLCAQPTGCSKNGKFLHDATRGQVCKGE